jgi:hypothetical protein
MSGPLKMEDPKADAAKAAAKAKKKK